MLKLNNNIAAGLTHKPIGSLWAAVGPTNTLTRRFCTYKQPRLTHSITRPHHQNSVLLTREAQFALSPLRYPSVRFFATNNDEKQTQLKEKEKENAGGFSDTIKRWEVKGKKIVKHYWLGTKLLYTNISITFKLVKSLIRGHTLSRRERKLLVQTSADIFRLVPFIIIVIIPFMELALPILLRFFPNLLPSTYEWKDKKDEDRAKRLRANVEMAKFLQEAMGELSLDLKKSNAVNADEFIDFMQKVKRGEKVTNKEIVIFSRLFEDELTLDKISREQLVAMHTYLHGNASQAIRWMSSDFLRTRISNKIEKIKQDDVLIQKEGLDALTLDELVDASIVRGMKVEGLNRTAIAKQLKSWLDLSLNQNVPPALLVLSRAFMMSRTEPAEEALEDTLAHIPQEALEEVVRELPADEVERTQERLEELAKERAMIDKMTKEEAKKAKEESKKAKEEIKKAKEETNKTKEDPKKAPETKQDVTTESKEEPQKADEDAETKEIKQLDTDVETLKQQSGKFLEEIGQAQNDPDAKSPKVLAKKLVGMIQGLEQEIDKIEKEKEQEKEKKDKKPEEKKPEEKKEAKKIEDNKSEAKAETTTQNTTTKEK